jgi:hypothetical protein
MSIAAETIRVTLNSINEAIESAKAIHSPSVSAATVAALQAAADTMNRECQRLWTITVTDNGVTVTDQDGEERETSRHSVLREMKACYPHAAVVDNRTPVAPQPTKVELHLDSAPLTSSERSKIKALGGDHTACRGHSNTRFVTLPLSFAGRWLADRLIEKHATHKRTVAVLRHYVDRDGVRAVDPSRNERILYIPNGSTLSDFC